MSFINYNRLNNLNYDSYPFPHIVIDNFLNDDKLDDILKNINILHDEDAQSKFLTPNSPNEFNKYAFNTNYGDYLKNLFIELNSEKFIKLLENLTGINDIITNDITLLGGGIHRIKQNGFLQLHTDFNTYYKENLKYDRRINLLIYMNPHWKDEYNGHLCLCDKESQQCY
jgi:Rps23 Pro-64 3,4-dihydroxylase Tpa1-like proline 4-hydroxylase